MRNYTIVQVARERLWVTRTTPPPPPANPAIESLFGVSAWKIEYVCAGCQRLWYLARFACVPRG